MILHLLIAVCCALSIRHHRHHYDICEIHLDTEIFTRQYDKATYVWRNVSKPFAAVTQRAFCFDANVSTRPVRVRCAECASNEETERSLHNLAMIVCYAIVVFVVAAFLALVFTIKHRVYDAKYLD